MSGADIPVPELQTAIHQPRIKEISYMGELDYFGSLQNICFNKDTLIASNPQGASGLEQMNNFQIFMTLINDPKALGSRKRQDDFISLMLLLIPDYTVTVLPRSIICSNQDTKQEFILDEKNFDIFRDVLEGISGIGNSLGGQTSQYNPASPRAAQIAAKLMRGRNRASAQGGEGPQGILSRYVSILTVGLHSMSLEDCLNLTVYQLYDLIERFGLYTSWDIDIRSRLAGGKPDGKPDDWMKEIHR